MVTFLLLINPKSTGLFAPGTALGGGGGGGGGGFPPHLCKIRSRHPKTLKLLGLIAYIMF